MCLYSLTLVPESIHQVTILMSDRGTPASYRHMNGYSSHTLRLVNASGEAFWAKFHYKTDVGIKNFTDAEAAEMRKNDPDHATRDLFEHIESGNAATWSVYIQVMPEAAAETYKWNVFDVTKVWPHSDYVSTDTSVFYHPALSNFVLRVFSSLLFLLASLYLTATLKITSLKLSSLPFLQATLCRVLRFLRIVCCKLVCSHTPTPIVTASAPTTCSCPLIALTSAA